MIWDSEYSETWQRKFALLPTYVDEGVQVVWLAHYWQRYVPSKCACNECGCKTTLGTWETASSNPREA